MRKTIQYGVDLDTGLVYSRVGAKVAVPILQWDQMTPANNFATSYELERMPVFALAGRQWASIRWMRKLLIATKNQHRAFWGMRPLPNGGTDDDR